MLNHSTWPVFPVFSDNAPYTYDGKIIKDPKVFMDSYRVMLENENFQMPVEYLAKEIRIQEQEFGDCHVGRIVRCTFHRFAGESVSRHHDYAGILVIEAFKDVPERVYLVGKPNHDACNDKYTWFEGKYIVFDNKTQEERVLLATVSILE